MGIDIRLPIGILFSLLGMILTGYGALGDISHYRPPLDVNINLVWGLVLLVFGVLMFLFWLDASDGIGWADAAVALAAAALLVFAIILARRGEKATWMARPRWYAYSLAALGTFVLIFGTTYADSYLLHRTSVSSKQLRDDTGLAIVFTAVTLWS